MLAVRVGVVVVVTTVLWGAWWGGQAAHTAHTLTHTTHAQPPGPPAASQDAVAQEGRVQYELMTREAQMPRYGDCYHRALADLHQDCGVLDDQVQSRLALAFTNCYLLRLGWPSYPCLPEQPLSACLGHMDARAASVFSSMLTSALSMCHFLQEQAWHRSSTLAMHRLVGASEDVGKQLAEAARSAATLKDQMDLQLMETNQAFKKAFTEIRESTAEQRGLIVDVFDQVSGLHKLLIDEFSWLYSVVFYVVGVVVSLVSTCTPHTAGARLPLFVCLTASLAAERLVVDGVLANLHPDVVQVERGVWMVRRVAAAASVVLLVRSVVFYRDPASARDARLEVLAQDTREIRRLLKTQEGQCADTDDSRVAGPSGLLSSQDTDTSDSDWEYEHLPQLLPLLNNYCETTNSKQQYSLRPRPSQPPSLNPALALETPQDFSFAVKQRERQSRYRSLQLRLDYRGVSHPLLTAVAEPRKSTHASLT